MKITVRSGRSTPAPYPQADLTALKLPWRLAPLRGKYYGTEVLNFSDEVVCSFWDHSTHWDHSAAPDAPSRRQAKDWGEGPYGDVMCDTHWESERDLAAAERLVDVMNTEGGFA